ncbi:MAG: hypothetical protein SNF33_01780 [Candidatus Algichlamydia australiensis]|nr:hypothetical protein [Chlamydiales bacterium]
MLTIVQEEGYNPQLLMDRAKQTPESLLRESFFEKEAPKQRSLLEELLLEEDLLQGDSVSDVLFRKGETKLLQGDASGFQFFELAAANDPENLELFYSMGLAAFHFGSAPSKEKYLLPAIRFLNRVKDAKSLHPLGCAYFILGKQRSENHYFQKAKEIFTEALESKDLIARDILPDLYWDHALAWVAIANQSGEALDTRLALQSFEKAAATKEKFPAEFWQIFGNTTICLAEQLNDFSLYQKGIEHLKHAVSCELSSFSCWYDLGQAFAKIFYLTLDEEHFVQASESFATATELGSNNLSVWTASAKLLLTAGTHTNNRKLLVSGLDKCKRAARFHNRNLEINILKARLLTAIGKSREEINWIYDGQNILNGIESKCKSDPEFFLAYGESLEALGIYYDDLDYHFQAIEKYQKGLSFRSTNFHIWYAMGRAYLYCFDYAGEREDLNLSLRFLKRALNLKGSSVHHYTLATALTKNAELEGKKAPLELALSQFEKAFSLHKNALYTLPRWHFEYASALDMLGDYEDDEGIYIQALDLLNQILLVDPEFPQIHYRLAIVYSHLGELLDDPSIFLRALHHYRLEEKRTDNEEQLLLDWGVTLISLGSSLENSEEAESYFQMARQKLTQAARHGYAPAFFHLACLEIQQENFPHAMRFLEKSEKHEVLPSYHELMHDEWLDPIRDEPAFKKFMQKFEDRTNKYG